MSDGTLPPDDMLGVDHSTPKDGALAQDETTTSTEIDLPKLLGEEINRDFDQNKETNPDSLGTDPETGWEGKIVGVYDLPGRDVMVKDDAGYLEEIVGTVSKEGVIIVMKRPKGGNGSSWSYTRTQYKLPKSENLYEPGKLESNEFLMRDGKLTHIRKTTDMFGGKQEVEETDYATAPVDKKRVIDGHLKDATLRMMGPIHPLRAQVTAIKP